MDTEILQNAGLTQKESQVYIALLEIGTTSASKIIERTGLHRAVVYDLLGRLLEKGLVSEITQGRKKYFEATNPNRLLDIIKEKEEGIKSILPRLLELSSFSEHLEVRVFKGKEGIKAVYEELLRDKPTIWYSMGSTGETYKLLPAYLEEFHERRIKLGVEAKGLLIESIESRKRGQVLSNKTLTRIRYLPKNFKTPTVLNIFGNKISLYSTTKDNAPFIILIDNEQVAKSFKEHFEWAWNISR